MSAFMSDRTPEERRYFRLQMLVYDILRAEDDGRLVAPRMVDGFVDQILALDAEAASPESAPPTPLEDPIPSHPMDSPRREK